MESEFLTKDEIMDIVFKNKRRFLNNIRLHVFNNEDQEDAFQDCTVNLLDKKILRDKADIYLSSCYKNFGIDVARKKRTSINHISIADIDFNRISEQEDHDISYEELLNEPIDDLKVFLKEAINNSQLSVKQIQILNLHYFDKMKYKDIAEIVNETHINTRGLSFKALDKIKSFLDLRKSDKYIFTQITDELIDNFKKEDKPILKALKEPCQLKYENRKVLDLLMFSKQSIEEVSATTGIEIKTIRRLIRKIKSNDQESINTRIINMDINTELSDKHKIIVELTNKNMSPKDIAMVIGEPARYVRNALYFIRKTKTK